MKVEAKPSNLAKNDILDAWHEFGKVLFVSK